MRIVVVSMVALSACRSKPRADETGDASGPPIETIAIPPERARAVPACEPEPRIEIFDVRREPRAIASDGEFLYWVDSGSFVEEPELHWVDDGALWRLPVGGKSTEQVAGELAAPSSLAVGTHDVFVGFVGESAGLLAVAKSGGAKRWITRDQVEHVAASGDDVYFVTEGKPDSGDDRYTIYRGKPDSVWRSRAGGPPELIHDRVGQVTAFVSSDAIVVGGHAEANGDIDGWVGLDPSGSGKRLSITSHPVRAIADEGAHVLVAARWFLLSIPKAGSGWSVRAVAADDIESVTVDPLGATWLATDVGAFSIVASTPNGDVRVVERPGMAGRHATDDAYIYWTEPPRAYDPSERATIGRVARTACR